MFIDFAKERRPIPARSTQCSHDTLAFQALQIHEGHPDLLNNFLWHYPHLHPNTRHRAPNAVDTMRSPSYPPRIHPQTSAADQIQMQPVTSFQREPSTARSSSQGYFPVDLADLNLTHTSSSASEASPFPYNHQAWGPQAPSYPAAPPAAAFPPAVNAAPPASAFDHDPHHYHSMHHQHAAPHGGAMPPLHDRLPVPPHLRSATATAPPTMLPRSTTPPFLPQPSREPSTQAAAIPFSAANGLYPPAHMRHDSLSAAPPSSPSTTPSQDTLSPRTVSSNGAATHGYLPAVVFAPPLQRQVYPSANAPPQPQYPPVAGTQPAPPGPGRKRALLIGCCYPSTQDWIRGACNDVERMRHFLCSRSGFAYTDVRVLIDEPRPSEPVINAKMLPTKENILREMHDLVRDAQAGDSLFFHFSGHGCQVPDTSPTPELDGMNEALCPTDWRTAGPIVDDNINSCLVNPLAPGVRLHALIDACHSGTAMDLPYSFQYDHESGYVRTAQGDLSAGKGTRGGFAAMFSACADGEFAADTVSLGHSYHSGVATSCFVRACERILDAQHELTYLAVLAEMSVRVRKYEQERSAAGGDRGVWFVPVRARRAVARVQGFISGVAQLFRRPSGQAQSCQTPHLSVSSLAVPSSCTTHVKGSFLDHVMRL